ncbi:MAG: linear amide C-N hydrolase [Candidatus Bathyarchaeota archaeon]|nr:linear amide C-N hydrolase [Candidatus Bathyarchaeota archaeon]
MVKIWFIVPVVIVLIVFGVIVYRSFSPFFSEDGTQASVSSGPRGFEKVNDYPLYVMRFEGDYGFSEYLKTGRLDAGFTDGSAPSCTVFAALGTGGDPIVGRNFDFPRNPALLLFTDPPDGYASVSMVDLGYFGYSMGRLPDPDEGVEGLRMTPYLPFDGMNEHGLVVGMAAIPHAESPHDPEKGTIGEIQVIRLLLDRAKDVDEALEFLEDYNIELAEPPVHYIVADRSRNSAIIELVGGEMKVLRSDEPWQVITNFVIHGSGAPEVVSCPRYRSTYDGLKDSGGRVSIKDAMSILEEASLESTIWSIVYNMETGEIHIAMGGEYGKVLTFQASSEQT